MYFWNINALVHKLKTNTLSTYEQAQYYITLMLCTSFAISIQQFVHQTPTQINVLQTLLSMFLGMAMMVGGVIYCYNINKSGDDKDFLTRMLCLIFTGAIRYGLMSMLIIIPFSLITGYLVKVLISPTAIVDNPVPVALISGTIGLLWTLGLYYYIGKQFRKVAHYI